jgi:Gas vesicle synthesis protein GvpL/GvpF
VSDELGRWARRRLPDVVARAEEQAVAELARALVRAAAEPPQASSAPTTEAPPPAPQPEREPDTGLWVYCVARAEDAVAIDAAPVQPGAGMETVVHQGLAALVSAVPMSDFGTDALTRNLNDLEWLERVARRHEAVLEDALGAATIVPLRLCTIYRDAEGVRRMLDEEHPELEAALERLEGREEWGVKLLADSDALLAAARVRSAEAEELERRLDGSTEGEAYMLRRRLERQLREEADTLGAELAEDVHARLQDWADAAVVNAPQNRELSKHEGEMLLNGAYLVPRAKVERVREVVQQLSERHRALGVRIELTGPWPPYNFVSGRSPAEPAPA